ncbi:VWA domain-containing protein [Gordonia oryzae]|uniref:VWA domain-containing protein n=1 Tax=Gordonia oryzae TaxID=2487349 RepID=A0A3N4GF54_9ACTN|nr:vWA domain-containing protein [Gordonia oryzae]RPA60007.1 VWA domain-containing protein [Gordonia oryzae]
MTRRRGARHTHPRTLAPLLRKPKHLDTEPDLLVPGAGGAGWVLLGRNDRRPPGAPGTPGSTQPGMTSETGELDTPHHPSIHDDEARRRARQIARKLALTEVVRSPRAPRSATGTLRTGRWRGDSDEIDLDVTLEAIAANPLPTDDDIAVRRRIRRRRSVVIVVDISGSARGEQVRTAAATVGALTGELSRDAVSVIAFWSDAAIISRLGDPVDPDRVIDALLTLPTRGLTNLSFALRTAADQLRGVPAADSRVLLLSDCVHNAGADPREIPGTLNRLDVLVDVSGEHDLELAADLALLGHGRCLPIRDHRGVAPALRTIFEN